MIHSKGLLYFYCSGRSNLHLCDLAHTEKVADIESEAAKQIQTEIDRLSSGNHSDPQVDSHNAEKIEIAKINEQIGILIDRLEEANTVTMKYINERIAALDCRRSELLKIINQPPIRPSFKLTDCEFASLDFNEKKAVAQALVKKIESSPIEVTVYFK